MEGKTRGHIYNIYIVRHTNIISHDQIAPPPLKDYLILNQRMRKKEDKVFFFS